MTSIFLSGFALLSSAAVADPPFYGDKINLLTYRDSGGEDLPVNTLEDWTVRRKHIVENMQLVMGPVRPVQPQPPPTFDVIEEVDLPSYVRKKISFVVEGDDRLFAYLLVPKNSSSPRPAALCLHPTYHGGKDMVVGLGDKPNRNYATELAERGYVTLAPDYPGFGDSSDIDVYAMGYASATAKGIVNHMRCVDVLHSLPEVDGERMAAIGHSLGGHNALFLSVFDERVKAVVTSCGFNRFAKYYGGDLTGWSHKGYMPRIAEVYDKDPDKMPFDFTEILAAVAPRPLFINAPLRDANFEVSGVYDCIEAALPVYELFAARRKLVSVHPDCEHDFPPDVRERAYDFLDDALNFKPQPR